MLGQQHHEKKSSITFKKMGTAVEFGSELKGFEQFEDHIIVQIVRRSHAEESLEETRVPLLVGTDRGHSIVRKTLALSFLGETREADDMVVGDFKSRRDLMVMR
jgi:2-polyprenyl-6-methoxyphenol hydroxylase-like FAD-dependent oxidoreductase